MSWNLTKYQHKEMIQEEAWINAKFKKEPKKSNGEAVICLIMHILTDIVSSLSVIRDGTLAWGRIGFSLIYLEDLVQVKK